MTHREEILKKQRDYLYPSVATYYDDPPVMERGQGMYLYDSEGERYLDFFGGILTVSVGHCNPRVTERVTEQVKKLVHTSTLYVTEPQVLLAERLAEITPGPLSQTFFTNSGTEADETAVLTAQMFTDRQEIVALRHSYSGRSMLAMSLTAHHNWRIGGTHIAGIKHAHSPYCYRCAFGREYPNCDLECAEDIEELIQTTTSGKIAAFFAEPIQGVGGFITPPPEYFARVMEIIKNYGGLFICDEVQTGFGRTGDHWFGIEHWGVQPDIITCAKGIANGAPMAATVATPELASAWKGKTISTFGGNPVSSVAALATLDEIQERDLLTHSRVNGDRLRSGLEALREKYSVIGDVRGMGLMQGIEVVRADKVPAGDLVDRIFEQSRSKSLLIGRGGLYGNVIRISPPLVVKSDEVDEALEILDGAFASLGADAHVG